METPIGKLRKTRGIPIQKGNQGSVARNVRVYYPHNISIDLFRRQIHSSLDLNQPAQTESPDQDSFLAGHEVNSRVELASKEIGKRSMKSTTLGTLLPPPPPQRAYLTSIMDSRLGGTARDELPHLIVMGCTRCYMYVMVPKAHPRCPKCKNRALVIGKFRGNCSKNLKKS